MFDVVRMIGSARILEKSISSIRKCFWTLFYFVLPDTDLKGLVHDNAHV